MAISDVYGTHVLEQIIRTHLEKGEVPTVEEITEEFNTFVQANDINAPLFTNAEHTVVRNESSSAGKANRTNTAIKQDIDILIHSMYQTAKRSTQLFDRWTTKADKLENRAVDLEAKMSRLLAITQDTAGFFDVVGDKFTDTSRIDLDSSSNLVIDLKQNLISMAKGTGSSATVSRVFLNNLLPTQSRFTLITNDTKILRVTNETNTNPIYSFYDENRYWKMHVFSTGKLNSITGELTLSLDEPISLSTIRIQLHTSQSNSIMKITPLYSIDGVNYNRVPASNTLIETLSTAEFVFPEIQGQYFKFIFEKVGHDIIDSSGNFVYEFGAKEISFFKEAFSDDPSFKSTLISKPLSITNPDGELVQFSKVTLETCDSKPDETSINYYVSVARDQDGSPEWLTSTGFSTSPIVGGVDTRLWSPIAPLDNDEVTHPELLDFATLSSLTRENISISYDRDGGFFVSPAQNFTYMTTTTATTGIDVEATTASGFDNNRYFMPRSANKILDLQIEKALKLDRRNLVLWRNIGEKSITPGDTTKLVRGVQQGWEYTAPYYSTVVKVSNTQGLSIDVGNNPITIDNQSYTGIISPSVLSRGIHKIKVHKDYWREVPPNLTTLAELKISDVLYPYNQKLLIEGYVYDSAWVSEQKYAGVDIFAGLLCDQVSVFDMIHNTPTADYAKFALDTDAPVTSQFVLAPNDTTPLSYVFLVNINNSIADFMNEQFVLEFNLTDELYSYVAFKAELSTETTLAGPVLDEYRIKLGS